MAKDKAGDKKAPERRPQAQKRDIQNKKRRLINKSFLSSLRTTLKQFAAAVEKGDKEAITASLKESYSMLDKAAKRGILKLNAASRKKSRLTAQASAKLA